MELIDVVSIFRKVKRLISFWYWNGKLFVWKDVCNLLCVVGSVYIWGYDEFGIGMICNDLGFV
jgi:hypothetical protein